MIELNIDGQRYAQQSPSDSEDDILRLARDTADAVLEHYGIEHLYRFESIAI